MTYQVKLPSCAYGGEGSMEKLKEIVADEGAKKSLYFLTGELKQRDF